MSPCYTHYFVCIAPQWSWDDVFFSAGLLIIVTTIFPQFSLIDGIQKIQREGSLHNTERTAKFFWQKESLKQWKQRAHLWLCFWKQTSLKTFFSEWRNQDFFFKTSHLSFSHLHPKIIFLVPDVVLWIYEAFANSNNAK